MRRKSIHKHLIRAWVLICLQVCTLGLISPAHAQISNEVSIGVLAHRGEAKARQMWEPTARYLEAQIPGYRFRLLPLSLEQMRQAVERDELDFILTNPGHYVNLEAAYGITRVATLKNMRQGRPYTSFGAVILVRADREDINTLSDLKGKSFAAVSKGAFGGFQMGWRALKDAGIDPFEDLSRIDFMGFPQDNIVRSVRDAKVDAGTVRTDTLERMAKAGEIQLEDFRVLNQETTPDFPFLHSTLLYPEWPFARARSTPDEFASQVVIALLRLSPYHPASKAGLNAGWTVPLSYQGVHDLFQELEIGPYAQVGKVTLKQIISQYRYWLMAIAAALVFAIYHFIRVERLVTKRTAELSDANRALENEIVEHTRSEQEARTYRDHLQLLMDSTAEAILGIDKEGLCTFANQNCVRLLGYKLELELLDKDLKDILYIANPNDSGQEPKDTPLMTAIMRDESRHSDSEQCRRNDGSFFPVEYWVHQIENDGITEGHVITFIDITRRKRVDAELAKHREQLAELVEERTAELQKSNEVLKTEIAERAHAETALKRANEELHSNVTKLRETQTQLVQSEKMASLGSLVAGFSHEINTPLGIGVTSATNIQEEMRKLSEAFETGAMKRSDLEGFIDHTQQASDILMRNLQRASELIRSFKQVAVDQSSDAWRSIDLQEYIDEIILSLKPKWKHTAIKLVNECEPELDIYSHPGVIYQILSNLIINALIYAYDKDQSGLITIRAWRNGESITMDISDNGKGIPLEYQNNIFDPFFTTRRGSGGSGLGLHIVYNLVTGTLKGTIGFASSHTEGTVFHIVFPYKTENSA